MSYTEPVRLLRSEVPDLYSADRLSRREREVVSLISQGLTNQEIAEKLYLSVNSVKTYIRTAYRRIDVTRRSQAVIWGIRNEQRLLELSGTVLRAVPTDRRA
jgi:DNA-binding CsgD family transcriptional regulator